MEYENLNITQGIIQVCIGFTASIIGLALIIKPSGELIGLSNTLISNTRFSSYIMAGIILFLFGILNFISSTFSFTKEKQSGIIGIIIGVLLIVISFSSLKIDINPAIYLYMILGAIEIIIGAILTVKK